MKKQNNTLASCVVGLALLATYNVTYAEINDGLGQSFSQPSKPKPVVPVPNTMTAPITANQGRVLEVIEGSGYSYMHLEADGQKFWVAGTGVSVKKGDKVSFQQSVAMNGFTSKSLNRTFDKIIFASAVTVLDK